MGSGGYGTQGGAAFKLTTDELTLDGAISVDGVRGAPGQRHSGSAGGSVWIDTKLLRGSAGKVSSWGGAKQWTGASGGGGGRIALYCGSSEYTGTGGHGWMLPSLEAFGGDGEGEVWDGACGTVYIDCGVANNTLLIDNNGRDSDAQKTTLVDPGLTTYHFNEVRILGGAKLAFAPVSSSTSAVTVSIDAATGDASSSGSIYAEAYPGRTQRVVLVMSGNAGANAIQLDSHYQSAAGSVAPSSAGSTFAASWSREYYLSGALMLSQYSVHVGAGSELVSPSRLTIQHVRLELEGVLRGVSSLTVADGGSAVLRRTGGAVGPGSTNSSQAGTFALDTVLVAGYSATGSGATADLYLHTGVEVVSRQVTVSKGTVHVDGVTHVTATRFNLTSSGAVDGAGRGSHGSNLGPGNAHSSNPDKELDCAK